MICRETLRIDFHMNDVWKYDYHLIRRVNKHWHVFCGQKSKLENGNGWSVVATMIINMISKNLQLKFKRIYNAYSWYWGMNTQMMVTLP